MALINFLHPVLKPSVNCTAASEDDHPIENLITSNIWKQNQGFIAYNITKPPVDVVITLSCPVNIKKLVIWTSCGSLRSTGFEIYVKSKHEFIKVGTARDLNIDVVTFNSPVEDHCPTESSRLQHWFFSNKIAATTLKSSQFVKIVIKSTKKCPPVLRKVEIWGEPASSLTDNEKESILNLWAKEKMNANNLKVQATSSDGRKDEELAAKQFPEEFLDAITFEVMITPMTLPCGKVIDQSTVEKHSLIENKWGRTSSDPFTGQYYTAERKPVFNSVLKSRIDQYLITHAQRNDVKCLPRTLGRRPASREEDYSVERNQKQQKLQHFNTLNVGSTSNLGLDDLVKKALQNVTSYSRPPIKKVHSCSKCGALNNLYTISTCKHLLCKTCLNTFKDQHKCFCLRSFESTDVAKFNL